MTFASWVVGRSARLPPARHRDVRVQRDLAAPMADGVSLFADRWYPATADRSPVVLLRSPYGRRQLGLIGRLLAERGYQTVIQSVRGTFGSGGRWDPFRNERADGRSSLEWLAAQPWFAGSVATYGPSYLGLTQWAVLADPPPYVRAMAMQVTASRFRDAVVYPGGSFAYETGAVWLYQLEHQERSLPRAIAAQRRAGRSLAAVSRALPLSTADEVGLGRRIDYYQDWLEHNRPGDPWWDQVDFGTSVEHAPPVSMVGGWHDIFLPSQMLDYTALVGAGRQVRLTVGPWTHTNLGAMGAGLRDGVEWFDEHLQGRAPALRAPVRLFVMGSRRWVDVGGWPPPAQPQRWYLQPGGGLSPGAPAAAGSDRFRYDPADPTPGLGGPTLNWRAAGPRDQAARESRPDVLCYTSEVLTSDLTVAGPLAAEIWLRSSLPHTDVFVRLCDVSPKGVSKNVADGILRVQPGDSEPDGDGVLRLQVPMWPTAMTWRRGHRIRLQVSSGAHPLFVRNLGSGEALGEGTRLCPADQEVFCDARRPSSITLPVSTI